MLLFLVAAMLIMVEGNPEPRWKIERPRVEAQEDMERSRFDAQLEVKQASDEARYEIEMKQSPDEAQKKMEQTPRQDHLHKRGSRRGANYGCTSSDWCWKYCGTNRKWCYTGYGCVKDPNGMGLYVPSVCPIYSAQKLTEKTTEGCDSKGCS